MIPSTQFECTEPQHPLAEGSPFRLVCGIGLRGRQFRKQVGFQQRLEERASQDKAFRYKLADIVLMKA